MIEFGMLDPRLTNIGHDANAIDCDGSPRDALVARFRDLVVAGRLSVVVADGVRDEVQHPHTPADVKAAVLPRTGAPTMEGVMKLIDLISDTDVCARLNRTSLDCAYTCVGRISTGESRRSWRAYAQAKDFAEDWYLELRGKHRRGEIKGGKTFRQAADQFLREYEIIAEVRFNED